MALPLKKNPRHRQESFLFLLMGLILVGLLISGYFLFVDKILPGITAGGPQPETTATTAGNPSVAPGASPDGITPGELLPGDGQVVTLYFGTRGKDRLYRELRKIPEEKMLLGQAENLVRELLRGPFNPEARAVIPTGTQLRGVYFHQGTFFVDLSRELTEGHPGGPMEEALTVYSLVNTLTELDHKARVKVLINGAETETLKGHVGLRESLTRLESLAISAL